MKQAGFQPHVLDIGGGFPGSDAPGGDDATFAEIATVVNAMLEAHFPDKTIRVIAEPGRFFAHSAFSLACNILGKKNLPEAAMSAEPASSGTAQLASPQQPGGQVSSEEEDAQVSYTIGDGIYGSFNSLLYDHAVVHPIPLVLGEEVYSPWKPATVFGPTCDGLDRVCDSVLLPAGLRPGRDWLLFEDMGAYTLAAGSTFNGIQRADVHYIYSDPASSSAGSILELENEIGCEVESEEYFKTEEVRPAVRAEYEMVAAAGAAGHHHDAIPPRSRL